MESNIAQGKERVIKQTGIVGMHLTSGYTLIDHEGDECNHIRTSPRGAQSMAKPRSRQANMDIKHRSMCREGKIPDLSQADTLYYQVHKIQPITKHHVLLLGFAITTQKPTEIYQVSCKNQSHLSTCKR